MSAPLTVTRRLSPFGHLAPSSLEEVITALHEHGGAAPLAGGTDLLALMKLGVEKPECVVSLKGISGLDHIREEAGVLREHVRREEAAVGQRYHVVEEALVGR